jgi:hypothetical protein
MREQCSRGRRTVTVKGEVVIKLQEPAASRRERLRTEAGRTVGQQTGLFDVPKILSFDDSRGEIVFERLSMTRFRQALSGGNQGTELVHRAAMALAAIHRRLELNDVVAGGSPGGLGTSYRGSVPLHGDFGMRNIFCIPSTDRLVLIDWTNADWIGVDADVGPPEIDLAVFLVSLFHRRVFGPLPISCRHDMACRFLVTYAAASPAGLDLGTLHAMVARVAPAFTQLIRRHKGHLQALAYRHAMVDLDFFLRRLSQRGLPSSGDHHPDSGRSAG